MDEFDEQIARARLAAQRAEAAKSAEKAKLREEAARARAVNDDARRSLEVAWRRVNAAIAALGPEPEGRLVSRTANDQMRRAHLAKEAARQRSLFGAWKSAGLDPAE